MSILNISDTIFVMSLGASASPQVLGNFTNDAMARQLANIRVCMFFEGLFTSERIKLTITDIATPANTYNSDTIIVKDLDAVLQTDSAWCGWVRFDFAKQWVESSLGYRLTMTATNYTESAGHTINMVYDYPAPVWNGSRQSTFEDHPITFQVLGYERT